MKTIGLCMIVKNEAPVILRCLESVRVLVDYVQVEDTGSTDGTQDIVRAYLDREGLPGEVFDEPWRDFAHNRTIALERLRGVPDVDYALVMDADDVLVFDEQFDAAVFKQALTSNLYHFWIELGSVRYHRPQICSNRLEFRYRGVIHEFLDGPPGGFSSETAKGLHIAAGVEGARSRDPDKYRKDAEACERALAGETDPFLRSRYTFYMAQSWRDCGENEKALAAYLNRAELGFWAEEIFVSLYNAAQLKENLGHPDYEIIGMFLRAFEACPVRAESLHGAARYCRVHNKFYQGYMLAKQGLDLPRPAGGLFVEAWIYDYGLLDELAVNAYWTGRYQECLAACERLLFESKIPVDMRERIEANARFAREEIARSMPSGSTDAVERRRAENGSNAPRVGIFIHANWRTASTWFWSKFRQSKATTCYFEPFNELYTDLTAEQATSWGYQTWASGHPPGDPYCLEYLPLIRKSGGLRLFQPDIPFRWYIPIGGLQGELREKEKRYLSLLIRHATKNETIPVFGFTRSLGRIGALKKTFGGIHIFQRRNLWVQWLSYVSLKKTGESYFYHSLFVLIENCLDDEFINYIYDFLRKTTDAPIEVSLEEWLSETVAFSLFMAFHLYMYLHCEIVADLSIDVTSLARKLPYCSEIEDRLHHLLGMTISVADAFESERGDSLQIKLDAIDWAAIGNHARTAVNILAKLADHDKLCLLANALIDETKEEMVRSSNRFVAD